MLEAVLLGTGGMLPLPGRWLSSLLVRSGGHLILFDCGEGTQVAWRVTGWGFRKLSAICISHTHADHIAGLPGLLHAAANSGRTEPVPIFGPPGTGAVVAGLRTIAPDLPYSAPVNELEDGATFSLPGGLSGTVAAGLHGMEVIAYRLDLPRRPRFLVDRAEALGVPRDRWRALQAGTPVEAGGRIIRPDEVTGPPRPGLSLAYVTDTRPLPRLADLARGADLLVCEGTYGDDADRPKAIERRHMTFAEAAALASAAEARRLWLTHFSPALDDPEGWRESAAAVFPEVTVGRAGLREKLAFRDDPGAAADGGAAGHDRG
ncbi:MAG: ribonuclease Z [Chloroflexota bacterium]